MTIESIGEEDPRPASRAKRWACAIVTCVVISILAWAASLTTA